MKIKTVILRWVDQVAWIWAKKIPTLLLEENRKEEDQWEELVVVVTILKWSNLDLSGTE